MINKQKEKKRMVIWLDGEQPLTKFKNQYGKSLKDSWNIRDILKHSKGNLQEV